MNTTKRPKTKNEIASMTRLLADDHFGFIEVTGRRFPVIRKKNYMQGALLATGRFKLKEIGDIINRDYSSQIKLWYWFGEELKYDTALRGDFITFMLNMKDHGVFDYHVPNTRNTNCYFDGNQLDLISTKACFSFKVS